MEEKVATAEAPKQRRFDGSYALVYAAILGQLQRIGRECGYAIAVHGSMASDFDLLAVPWVDDALPAEELIDRISKYLGLLLHTNCPHPLPDNRPHGRRAWSFHFDPAFELPYGGPYIDLSVMPRDRDIADQMRSGSDSSKLADALQFFVDAIGLRRPGWEAIHDTMFSTEEHTAFDTAAKVLRDYRGY